jgi:hypothetical protein
MTIETWSAPQLTAGAALACAEQDRGSPHRRAKHLEAALAALGDLQRQVLLARLALDPEHRTTAGEIQPGAIPCQPAQSHTTPRSRRQ